MKLTEGELKVLVRIVRRDMERMPLADCRASLMVTDEQWEQIVAAIEGDGAGRAAY